jgi:hypothetical protein
VREDRPHPADQVAVGSSAEVTVYTK